MKGFGMKGFGIMVMACTVFAAGCTHHQAPENITRECLNYRSMMTAPVLPDVTEKLKNSCRQSVMNKNSLHNSVAM